MIPGYITNYTFAGTEYQVFAYTEDAGGVRTYLPSHTPTASMDKIRKLASGLLSAHDARRQAAAEAPYEVKKIDLAGLIKSDDASISHDFLLNSPLGSDMAALLGPPTDPSTLKAQIVWDALEKGVRDALASPASAPPPASSPAPAPAAATPPSPPPASPAAAAPPAAPPPLPGLDPFDRNRKIAIDLSMRGIDLNLPDWYDRLSPRVKLRILDATFSPAYQRPDLYRKVWGRFPTGDLIRAERARLSAGLATTPLQTKAEETVKIFHDWQLTATLVASRPYLKAQADALKDSLLRNIEELKTFLDGDIAAKEQLLQCVRELAVFEGIVIPDWDRQWALHHYLEDTHRLVQALAFWIDSS